MSQVFLQPSVTSYHLRETRQPHVLSLVYVAVFTLNLQGSLINGHGMSKQDVGLISLLDQLFSFIKFFEKSCNFCSLKAQNNKLK